MNEVTVAGLSRVQCALLVVFSMLTELEEAGFVEGCYRPSAEGNRLARELRDGGFEFNPGEQEEILHYLFTTPVED